MATIMQLNDYLNRCHRYDQQQLHAVRRKVHRQAWQQGQTACHELCARLDGRFHDEESLLYPLLERSCQQPTGPTTILRYQHEQIRELLEALFQAVCRRDGPGSMALTRTLQPLLQQHHARECTVLGALCHPEPAQLAQLLRQASQG